jgi:hypothetical protein
MGLFGSSRSSSTSNQEIDELVSTVSDVEEGARVVSGTDVDVTDGAQLGNVALSGASDLELNILTETTDLGAIEAGKAISLDALELSTEAIESQERALETALGFASDQNADLLDSLSQSSRETTELVSETTRSAVEAILESQEGSATVVKESVNALATGFRSAIGSVETAFKNPDERAFSVNSQNLMLLAFGVGVFLILRESK